MRIAIRHPKDPTRPTVIPASMFDPARHERWPEERPKATPLPSDLPGRAALVEAGINTLERLAEVPDLDEIPGIGQATEARIHAYFEHTARSYGETGSERPGSVASHADTPTGPGALDEEGV